MFTFLAVSIAYVLCKDVPVPRKEKVPELQRPNYEI